MELTHNHLLEILDYDKNSGLFRWKKRLSIRCQVGAIAGHKSKRDSRRMIRIASKPYVAARLAWFYVYGEWPNEIDHINVDPSDDRIENLRDVTHAQNQRNRSAQKNNKVGIKGVHFHKLYKKFGARICYEGKQTGLGYFDTAEEAAAAYAKASVKYHGEYGRT